MRALSSVPAFVSTSSVPEASTTSNGIRVVSETTGGETATIGVWIEAGSRYESPSTSGSSAWLAASVTGGALAAEIAALGGHVSATAGREMTALTASVAKKDVPAAMAVLAKMAAGPVDAKAAEDCHAAALATAEDSTLNYEGNLQEQLHEAAFLDTPLGLPIDGTPESLSKLTAADLAAYKKSLFTGGRMCVVGAGAVSHSELSKLSEQLLGAVPAADAAAVDFPMAPAVFTGSDKRIRFDSMPTATVALAFATPGAGEASADALKVMQMCLGSWDARGATGANSAFKLGREFGEHGIGLSYNCFNHTYKDAGLFGIELTAKDVNMEDTIWYTLDNLVRLCHNISEEEVARAKEFVKTHILGAHGSNAAHAASLGQQTLSVGRAMTLAEQFTRIDAIEVSDVRNVADSVINDEDHALAAVGPIFELPDYNFIRRRSYWHRF